ncbi:hypothetical protein [Indioceanicola profundi]|uniref:hypothetical protein n=1 Tax=Indioceanicola profundi TaxID=2220096 RepID=UPI0013C3F736|nr:hypothetical protein [Indioceanicola profundi]
MRKLTHTILPTLAVAAFALAAPAMAGENKDKSAQAHSTGSQSSTPANEQGEMTAPLPEDSLARERGGAIGENPEAVQQGGSGDDDSAEATTSTGALPDNSLVQERGGAIGENPEPVKQGGQDMLGSTESGSAEADSGSPDSKKGD